MNILVTKVRRFFKGKQILSVWDLDEDRTCWIISGKGSVIRYSSSHNLFKRRRDKGDVFLTEKSARKELEQRKKIAKSRKFGLIALT